MERPPREQRIDYAQGYIARNPNTSKRGLQAHLKETYGVGLRDSVVRGILQKANTPNILRNRINTPAFYPQERKELKQFLRKAITPYIIETVNQRYTAFSKEAQSFKDKGYTFQQYVTIFRRAVKKQAKDLNWLITSTTKEGRKKGRRIGQIDVYKMLKYYRRKAIEDGEYQPILKKTPRIVDIDKQRVKHSERTKRTATIQNQERERQTLYRQASALESKMLQTHGEERERLKREIAAIDAKLRKMS
jgi:rubrerythrin